MTLETELEEQSLEWESLGVREQIVDGKVMPTKDARVLISKTCE